MEQVIATLARYNPALDGHDSELKPNLVPEDISDSASMESIESVSDVIADMRLCTECLVDLLPSLENPAKDTDFVEPSRAPNPVPEGSQPWWPFFLGIEDKFPSAERGLVIRIGEANWRRWEKIRLNRATRFEALGNEPVVYK
jgi:hypothetical protein